MKAIYLNTELARPIGIVNGTSVNLKRKPRTYGKASDCIVTHADGTQRLIPANPPRTPRTSVNGKPRTHTVKLDAIDTANLRDRRVNRFGQVIG